MELKPDQLVTMDSPREDSLDQPDCLGEFSKKNKLCLTYCAFSIKCCVMKEKNPKVDVLERLLIYNDFSAKPN